MAFQLLLVVSALMIHFESTLTASCVANEGSRHSISFQVTDQQPARVKNANWAKGRATFPTVLTECISNDNGVTYTCTSRFPSEYEMREDNKNFTLTILKVTRVEELVHYTFNTDVQEKLFECDLNVYAPPESPRCDRPSLTSDNTALSVTCSTDKVFPQARCVFYRQEVQVEQPDVSYRNESITSDGLNYYKTSCTLTYSINNKGEGSYSFSVDMFVNIKNIRYGLVRSPVSDSITLTLPEVGLATACFSGDNVKDGYIKQGTTATCRCNRTKDGLPVGQVQWYDTLNQPVGEVAPNGRFATITVPIDDAVPNFTCKGKSNLGVQTSGEPLSLIFAYGPTQVNISPGDSSSTTVDLCSPDTNHDVIIQCHVPQDNVSPSPTFTVFFDDTPVSGVSTNVMYTYRATKTVDTAGNYRAICRAVNSVFSDSDLKEEDGMEISVREPPSSPPQLIINNNQPVVENVPFTVSCRVDGGFPLVSGVSVTCRSDHNMTSVTNDTNVASQSMTVSRDMDGVPCDCEAQHVTKCYYNNKATTNLNVTYRPVIKTFTANNSKNLTVDLHDHVNLTCVTDGNPTPTITIQKNRNTDLRTDEGHSLTYVKDNVTCTDTSTYNCKVDNNVTTGQTSEGKVQVFVKCPQQRRHEDNTTFAAILGNSVTLDLDVIGYPAPISYTLERKQIAVAQVNTTDGNGESGTYQFKYLSDDPPFGTVKLTIEKLSKEHFTNYLLTINNGVGQALEYSFVLETGVPESDKDIVPIVAGVIGGVLFLVIIGAVIFLLKRRGVFDKRDRAHSSRLDDNEVEHVIPNDLYSGGSNSGEVVVNNSDLYSGNWNRKSNEVVIDNSDLYSGFSKQGSNEVVVDNSALYGKSDDFKATREALYKNYTDVTPSMTSATAVPVNMKAANGAKQGGNSSYEDVEVGAKSEGPSVQAKPKVAVKPMTAAKPTPAPKPGGPSTSTSASQGAFALQDGGGDQTYASVIRTGKPQAPKTQPASQRESDYFPDQSKKPEVPEKRYEQEESLTGQEEKKKQKKPGADKKNKNKKADEIPMVPHGGAAASSSHDNPYVNGGFTEDDGNVYANAEGNKSRKD